ncbi:hypothetical protein C2845_PM05G32140 [Panicum miliaceum]|uniref:Uncharacterized protein n=1 Tax=Panicum miliaceum TaxID=4540 RepID=A0A3L6T4L1_PANMI|nr:hypothetical protein C2845_PM05G32140 [Panicum miliaceum]
MRPGVKHDVFDDHMEAAGKRYQSRLGLPDLKRKNCTMGCLLLHGRRSAMVWGRCNPRKRTNLPDQPQF